MALDRQQGVPKLHTHPKHHSQQPCIPPTWGAEEGAPSSSPMHFPLVFWPVMKKYIASYIFFSITKSKSLCLSSAGTIT